MAGNRLQTVLRIDEEVYEKIRILAARDRRSINNMIEGILQQYVENCEQQTGTILLKTKENS
ncbi:MAG: Arc family DNA-binding protein [Clostridiales bacterium]|nr:Arc family DNA-binding protein [Clostridiales bacterium]